MTIIDSAQRLKDYIARRVSGRGIVMPTSSEVRAVRNHVNGSRSKVADAQPTHPGVLVAREGDISYDLLTGEVQEHYGATTATQLKPDQQVSSTGKKVFIGLGYTLTGAAAGTAAAGFVLAPGIALADDAHGGNANQDHALLQLDDILNGPRLDIDDALRYGQLGFTLGDHQGPGRMKDGIRGDHAGGDFSYLTAQGLVIVNPSKHQLASNSNTGKMILGKVLSPDAVFAHGKLDLGTPLTQYQSLALELMASYKLGILKSNNKAPNWETADSAGKFYATVAPILGLSTEQTKTLYEEQLKIRYGGRLVLNAGSNIGPGIDRSTLMLEQVFETGDYSAPNNTGGRLSGSNLRVVYNFRLGDLAESLMNRGLADPSQPESRTNHRKSLARYQGETPAEHGLSGVTLELFYNRENTDFDGSLAGTNSDSETSYGAALVLPGTLKGVPLIARLEAKTGKSDGRADDLRVRSSGELTNNSSLAVKLIFAPAVGKSGKKLYVPLGFEIGGEKGEPEFILTAGVGYKF